MSAVVDEVFDLLANSRRRQMLWHLDAVGKTSLRELAEVIASSEEDRPVADLSSEEIRRVYISLYQYHAPNLAEENVLEIDEKRQVRLADTRKAEIALSYLKYSPEEQSSGLLSTARGLVGGESR